MPHSARFRAWEAEYPLLDQARRLEAIWAKILCNLELYERLEDSHDTTVQADQTSLAQVRPIALEHLI